MKLVLMAAVLVLLSGCYPYPWYGHHHGYRGDGYYGRGYDDGYGRGYGDGRRGWRDRDRYDRYR